jgi:hypothetical protein
VTKKNNRKAPISECGLKTKGPLKDKYPFKINHPQKPSTTKQLSNIKNGKTKKNTNSKHLNLLNNMNSSQNPLPSLQANPTPQPSSQRMKNNGLSNKPKCNASEALTISSHNTWTSTVATSKPAKVY